MSVLIKGMGIPKHCWQCPFHDDMDDCILLNQSCMKVWGENKRLDECPLVEVHTPHGRLIDKEALESDISHSVVFTAKSGTDPEIRGAKKIIQRINIAPTVIEAEEGT